MSWLLAVLAVVAVVALLTLFRREIANAALHRLGDSKIAGVALVPLYRRLYSVDMTGFDVSRLDTLQRLFQRQFRNLSASRPRGAGWLLHPSDGTLAVCSSADGGRVVKDGLPLSQCTAADALRRPRGSGDTITLGTHAALVYYLAPGDYHRTFWPVSGTVTEVASFGGGGGFLNGRLSRDSYTRNNRTAVTIRTRRGVVRCVLVGSTYVGSVEMVAAVGDRVRAGGPMAAFRLGGSTCVVFVPRGAAPAATFRHRLVYARAAAHQ